MNSPCRFKMTRELLPNCGELVTVRSRTVAYARGPYCYQVPVRVAFFVCNFRLLPLCESIKWKRVSRSPFLEENSSLALLRLLFRRRGPITALVLVPMTSVATARGASRVSQKRGEKGGASTITADQRGYAVPPTHPAGMSFFLRSQEKSILQKILAMNSSSEEEEKLEWNEVHVSGSPKIKHSAAMKMMNMSTDASDHVYYRIHAGPDASISVYQGPSHLSKVVDVLQNGSVVTCFSECHDPKNCLRQDRRGNFIRIRDPIFGGWVHLMDIKSKAEHAVERLPPKSLDAVWWKSMWSGNGSLTKKPVAMGIAKGPVYNMSGKKISDPRWSIDQTAAAPAPAGNQRTQHAQNAWQRLLQRYEYQYEQCESPNPVVKAQSMTDLIARRASVLAKESHQNHKQPRTSSHGLWDFGGTTHRPWPPSTALQMGAANRRSELQASPVASSANGSEAGAKIGVTLTGNGNGSSQNALDVGEQSEGRRRRRRRKRRGSSTTSSEHGGEAELYFGGGEMDLYFEGGAAEDSRHLPGNSNPMEPNDGSSSSSKPSSTRPKLQDGRTILSSGDLPPPASAEASYWRQARESQNVRDEETSVPFTRQQQPLYAAPASDEVGSTARRSSLGVSLSSEALRTPAGNSSKRLSDKNRAKSFDRDSRAIHSSARSFESTAPRQRSLISSALEGHPALQVPNDVASTTTGLADGGSATSSPAKPPTPNQVAMSWMESAAAQAELEDSVAARAAVDDASVVSDPSLSSSSRRVQRMSSAGASRTAPRRRRSGEPGTSAGYVVDSLPTQSNDHSDSASSNTDVGRFAPARSEPGGRIRSHSSDTGNGLATMLSDDSVFDTVSEHGGSALSQSLSEFSEFDLIEGPAPISPVQQTPPAHHAPSMAAQQMMNLKLSGSEFDLLGPIEEDPHELSAAPVEDPMKDETSATNAAVPQSVGVQVPPGVPPGAILLVEYNGQKLEVEVPPGATPGCTLEVRLPSPPDTRKRNGKSSPETPQLRV